MMNSGVAALFVNNDMFVRYNKNLKNKINIELRREVINQMWFSALHHQFCIVKCHESPKPKKFHIAGLVSNFFYKG